MCAFDVPIQQVISAQQLPKLNKDKPKSIVDPLVRVEIHGVPADSASEETHYIDNNGEDDVLIQYIDANVQFHIGGQINMEKCKRSSVDDDTDRVILMISSPLVQMSHALTEKKHY